MLLLVLLPLWSTNSICCRWVVVVVVGGNVIFERKRREEGGGYGKAQAECLCVCVFFSNFRLGIAAIKRWGFGFVDTEIG